MLQGVEDMADDTTSCNIDPDRFDAHRPPALIRACTPADRMRLSRLERAGVITRLDRGLYLKPGVEPGCHQEIAAIGLRRPEIVICLLSALSFHQLTLQLPHTVYVGIETGQRPPRWNWPSITPVALAPKKHPAGIVVHDVDGVRVRLTDPARSVADCWRFQAVVGLEATLEATKMALAERACTLDGIMQHLDHYGLTERVRPYLVGMTA